MHPENQERGTPQGDAPSQNSPYEPNPWGYTPYPRRPKNNSMATASLILGCLSIMTCLSGIGSLIFGSLGVLMAILARGRKSMDTHAKIGIGLSAAGMLLSLVIFTGIFLFFAKSDSLQKEFPSDYEDFYNDPYGSDNWDRFFH